VSNDKLQKKVPDSLKEKSQYALAFGVIAMMLFAVGFPSFVIAFFGIFAFFLWKTFATASPNTIREVFEFYLSANEILRDDERRWFGFEVQEIIARGERILQTMNGAPPLVYFTLGALYNKMGDHKAAVNHLAYVVENENSDEATYNYPSPELRNYTKILRKIEREPAEAPQTSSAVRALERARRNRGKSLLEQSRQAVEEINKKKRETETEQKRLKAEDAAAQNGKQSFLSTVSEAGINSFAETKERTEPVASPPRKPLQSVTVAEEPAKENGKSSSKEQNQNDLYNHRPPISEVLRDIYGEK
jgi:tetratricopeptide (TPR) repeat protein